VKQQPPDLNGLSRPGAQPDGNGLRRATAIGHRSEARAGELAPAPIAQIPGYSLQLTQMSVVGWRTLKTKARAHVRLSLFIFFVILA
jgi:hypothetical protein